MSNALIRERTNNAALRLGAGSIYAASITEACANFNITSPLEIAHLLAQLAHESANFRTATEYASGRAYEGRKDLGNVSPGDGVKFKGRGLIQCTGRSNYRAYSMWKYEDDRIVRYPATLADLPDAVDVALWYWCVQRPICRTRAHADDVVGVTRAINGGTNGLADRRAKLDKAKAAMGIS